MSCVLHSTHQSKLSLPGNLGAASPRPASTLCWSCGLIHTYNTTPPCGVGNGVHFNLSISQSGKCRCYFITHLFHIYGFYLASRGKLLKWILMNVFLFLKQVAIDAYDFSKQVRLYFTKIK